jgi:hypothetical protein
LKLLAGHDHRMRSGVFCSTFEQGRRLGVGGSDDFAGYSDYDVLNVHYIG